MTKQEIINTVLGVILAGAMFGVGYATAVVQIKEELLDVKIQASQKALEVKRFKDEVVREVLEKYQLEFERKKKEELDAE